MTSVYLLVGDEQLLKEEKLSELKSETLQKGAEPVDYNIFYAKDAKAKEIIESAYTQPFMSKKRVVVVKDADKLSAQDRDALISYMASPSKSTVLVLVADRIDRQNKLFDAVSSCGKVIQCNRLSETDITSWIINRGRFFRKKFDSKAVQILKEDLGNNLSELDNAISKLSIYLGPDREKITGADVEDLVGKSIANATFELVDAISQKDANKALGILSNLIRDSNKVYEIIGALGWHFKNMAKTKGLLEKRYSKARIGQELRIYPKRLNKLLNQVRNFKKEELVRGFELILNTDEQIKTSAARPSHALELLVIKLSLGI